MFSRLLRHRGHSAPPLDVGSQSAPRACEAASCQKKRPSTWPGRPTSKKQAWDNASYRRISETFLPGPTAPVAHAGAQKASRLSDRLARLAAGRLPAATPAQPFLQTSQQPEFAQDTGKKTQAQAAVWGRFVQDLKPREHSQATQLADRSHSGRSAQRDALGLWHASVALARRCKQNATHAQHKSRSPSLDFDWLPEAEADDPILTNYCFSAGQEPGILFDLEVQLPADHHVLDAPHDSNDVWETLNEA